MSTNTDASDLAKLAQEFKDFRALTENELKEALKMAVQHHNHIEQLEKRVSQLRTKEIDCPLTSQLKYIRYTLI